MGIFKIVKAAAICSADPLFPEIIIRHAKNVSPIANYPAKQELDRSWQRYDKVGKTQ